MLPIGEISAEYQGCGIDLNDLVGLAEMKQTMSSTKHDANVWTQYRG